MVSQQMTYEVIGLQTQTVIQPRDNLFAHLMTALEQSGEKIQEGDVLVVSSKVVSLCQGDILELSEISPSCQAYQLSERTALDPRMCEVIIQEAEEILGTVFKAVLTRCQYGLLPNAGVDLSNAPTGKLLLLPRHPDKAVSKLAREIYETYGKKVAVLITDSQIMPLRQGTLAITLASIGLKAVIDERGKEDLFGHKMAITTRAIADSLATAANVVMGETSERCPFVIIRGLDSAFLIGNPAEEKLEEEESKRAASKARQTMEEENEGIRGGKRENERGEEQDEEEQGRIIPLMPTDQCLIYAPLTNEKNRFP